MVDSSDGHLIILFLTLSILSGLLLTESLRRWRLSLPYEVCVLLLGVLLGLLLLAPSSSTVDLVQSVRLLGQVNPNVVLFCFLPILLFDSAFSINFHTLETVIAPTLLLAVPGVVIVTAATAGLVYLLFPYSWGWMPCLLFASLLSATDPVSTVAIMKQSHAFSQILTIVEAEALLNDGVAFILYSLFLNITLATDGVTSGGEGAGVLTTSGLNVGAEVGDLVRKSVGGPLFGWASALVAAFLLSRVPLHMAVEVTGTVVGAYLCYLLSTSYVGSSGILSLVVFGLFMGKWRSSGVSPQVHRALHAVWHWLVFVGNTVLFTIVGLLCARSLFTTPGVGATDFGYSVLLYLVLQLTRFAAVACIFPLSRVGGYSLSRHEAVMLCAAGLRGPISLMLALLTVLETGLDPALTGQIAFHTAAVVVLTNACNGTMAQWLVQVLRLNEEAMEDRVVLQEAMRRMAQSAEDEVDKIRAEPDYSRLEVDESFTCCWRRTSSSSSLEPAVLSRLPWESALTVRCLMVLKAEFTRLVERGVLSPGAFDRLSAACDRAVDRGSFATFVSAMDGLQRVPWWLHSGWELPLPSILHRPFDWLLQVHHLRSLEMCMSTAHSLSLCYAVIAAFTAIPCVEEDVRQRLGETVEEYEGRMRKQVKEMNRTFPAAARQLLQLRAFIALTREQDKRATELEELGLLTEVQKKLLRDVVQEQLQKQQSAMRDTSAIAEEHIEYILSPLVPGVERRLLRQLCREGRRRLFQVGEPLLEAEPSDCFFVATRGLVADLGPATSSHTARERFGPHVQVWHISAGDVTPDVREDGGEVEEAVTVVGLYSALTSQASPLRSVAVTAVETTRLSVSSLILLNSEREGWEAMWKMAAAEVVRTACPDLLAPAETRKESGWVKRLINSAQCGMGSSLANSWPERSRTFLLLLAGSISLVITARQRYILQAPAWMEDAPPLADGAADAGECFTVHGSQDAVYLLWTSSEEAEVDGDAPNPLMETGMGAPVEVICMDPAHGDSSYSRVGQDDEVELELELEEKQPGVVVQVEVEMTSSRSSPRSMRSPRAARSPRSPRSPRAPRTPRTPRSPR